MNKSTSTPQYGSTNPTPQQREVNPVKRFGSVIGLNPEKEQYYRELHANVWPTIIDIIRKANIRNNSIYVTEIEGKKYLFNYFEYVGEDFDTDMKTLSEHPETKRWWAETDPCQLQLPSRKPGANWNDMEMVFLME